MKLPSINYLYQRAKSSVVRFPLTILSSFIAVSIGIYLVEFEKNTTNFFPFINLMLCAALGIPLFFCIKVFTDKMKIDKIKSIVINAGGAVLLILLYFTLPNSEETANTSLPYIRYTIYNIALHLLVSFAPYLKGKQLNGFWQYNRVLFTRFILSVVYSGFLYIGIALAMGSMQLLFDVKIDGETYIEFFIFIAGFFNTWFFISGMPDDYDELDKIEVYPFGLKVFSQYILLPLLLLYLVILYMYGAKIIALWDWPKGVVSWLIIAISVLGIFTFLLIHPYGEKEQDSWIKKFTKIYYFLVIPLVVILFLAISIRLADYGITINRYIIILLGVWLTIVSGYFIIGKNNIKFIPISLCAMILLMSFGPWSMFSVSERSQTNRLKLILEEYGIVKDGKVVNEQTIVIDSNYYSQKYEYPNTKLVNDSICMEIKSIIDYLDNFHGFNALKDIYQQDLTANISAYNNHKTKWSKINEAEIYMTALGIEYKYYYVDNENSYFSYSTSYDQKLSEIAGYDYLVNLDYYAYQNNEETIITLDVDSQNIELRRIDKKVLELRVIKDSKEIIDISLTNLKNELINKYGKNYNNELPQDELTIIGENEHIVYKFEIQSIGFRKENNQFIVDSVNGKLMFRLKTKSIE
jgi:hypothetical protein